MNDEGTNVRQIRMGPTNGPLLLDPRILDTGQVWQLEDRNGFTQITGRLIGVASSHRTEHTHGGSNTAGEISNDARQITMRCTACRWSEIYIFHVAAGDGPPTSHYCVYTLGPSVVVGEKTFANIRWASSGHEVVELCTVRRGDRGAPFLPAAHARALAMASDIDGLVETAYVNRAVA